MIAVRAAANDVQQVVDLGRRLEGNAIHGVSVTRWFSKLNVKLKVFYLLF
jgi:hypothetical protein